MLRYELRSCWRTHHRQIVAVSLRETKLHLAERDGYFGVFRQSARSLRLALPGTYPALGSRHTCFRRCTSTRAPWIWFSTPYKSASDHAGEIGHLLGVGLNAISRLGGHDRTPANRPMPRSNCRLAAGVGRCYTSFRGPPFCRKTEVLAIRLASSTRPSPGQGHPNNAR